MSDGTVNFGTQKHRAFLDKLIQDDAVRAEFEKDPVKVLSQHGIGYDPANPPRPGKLPSKDKLREVRDTAVEAMQKNGGHPSMPRVEGTWPYSFDGNFQG